METEEPPLRKLCGSRGQAGDSFRVGDGRGHRGCLTEALCFPGLEGVGQYETSVSTRTGSAGKGRRLDAPSEHHMGHHAEVGWRGSPWHSTCQEDPSPIRNQSCTMTGSEN